MALKGDLPLEMLSTTTGSTTTTKTTTSTTTTTTPSTTIATTTIPVLTTTPVTMTTQTTKSSVTDLPQEALAETPTRLDPQSNSVTKRTMAREESSWPLLPTTQNAGKLGSVLILILCLSYV